MRIFERIRTSFGTAPIQPQNDPKETGDGSIAVATVPPAETEAMCCGHCSGNAKGHNSKLR
jgi:hypothetical protein